MISKENSFFYCLLFLMASIVALSNYLVQFPVNYFNLQHVLTYGAFSYPVAFLITDLSNRRYGKEKAKKLVYLGFITGIFLTFFFSTNFSDFISIRIAVASATAFIVAQLIDVNIFDKFRKKVWYVAPFLSSVIGSIIDTFIFFSIAFYATGINWISLALGDLFVKIFVAVIMLIPFRILLSYINNYSADEKNFSV